MILAIFELLTCVPAGMVSAEKSHTGSWGDAKWEVNGDIIVFSGEGKMGDCSTSGKGPWQAWDFPRVIIETALPALKMKLRFYVVSFTGRVDRMQKPMP